MSVVIDASVTMAWCFEDEATPFTEATLDHVQIHGAVAPSLWPIEVANTIVIGRRRNRLTPPEVATFLTTLRALPVTIVEGTPSRVWSSVLDLADSQRLSAYDATCLDLAVREHLPLATLDARLRDAALRVGVPLFAPDEPDVG